MNKTSQGVRPQIQTPSILYVEWILSIPDDSGDNSYSTDNANTIVNITAVHHLSNQIAQMWLPMTYITWAVNYDVQAHE